MESHSGPERASQAHTTTLPPCLTITIVKVLFQKFKVFVINIEENSDVPHYGLGFSFQCFLLFVQLSGCRLVRWMIGIPLLIRQNPLSHMHPCMGVCRNLGWPDP